MKNAQFIVIEGLEGAGKTTAINAITDWLSQQGIQFIKTREPGGTPLAESLRTLVKAPQQAEKITAEAELLIMYASRIQLIENVIKPALNKGVWVVGDRHDLSSRAYQGGGREISDELIEPIRQAVLKGFEPDLTLYLDIRPEVGLARASARGELDRIEQEALSFFERTRAKYQSIAATDPNIQTVDAEMTIPQVQACIKSQLDAHFSENVKVVES